MKYSNELLELILGLGIDVSKGPTYTRYQLESLVDETKDFTFGYLEGVASVTQSPIVIDGMKYFIHIKSVYNLFMREYERYLDFVEIKNVLHEIEKTKMGRESKARSFSSNQ